MLPGPCSGSCRGGLRQPVRGEQAPRGALLRRQGQEEDVLAAVEGGRGEDGGVLRAGHEDARVGDDGGAAVV